MSISMPRHVLNSISFTLQSAQIIKKGYVTNKIFFLLRKDLVKFSKNVKLDLKVCPSVKTYN